MKKIQNEIFFEEYEIFKKIFSERKNFFWCVKNFFGCVKNFFGFKNKKFFRILDLWCWNWRFNLLIDKIFTEKKINQKKIFYWVEKNFSENIKNFSDAFINSDIENFLEKKENFVWKIFFDFIILSWIFENFLKFNEEILNKLYKILEKNWVIYINFWNYWEEKNLFREKNISEVEKYFEENFLWEIRKSKFNLNNNIWENFEVFYNNKKKNNGRNISLILKK